MVLDHDFGWDDGLICGGSVSGLILPRAAEAAELWRKLAAVTEPICWGVKKDFSIALVEGRAGSPLPAAAVQTASGAHGVTRPTSEWLYQETVAPPSALWIAGSGHVAQAVAPLALQLDFAVTIFDDRPELANHQFFPPERPTSSRRLARTFESAAAEIARVRPHRHARPPARRAGAVRVDSSPVCFSRHDWQPPQGAHHARAVFEAKHRHGGTIRRLACPVGMDIKAVSTHEIAVSVMAQFIQKRAEFDGVRRGEIFMNTAPAS